MLKNSILILKPFNPNIILIVLIISFLCWKTKKPKTLKKHHQQRIHLVI
ncbi:hypothetical protein RC62_2076 [Flavobacterium aquidurense]|uniref:Uncharacterized protein n=1 Tax=Flavobacterium aquidurense TaxID=362413 RepID=A0A0N8VM97_9FLAO|nr:hypothetical protein RC62_2076 [Flavobacterium aquidurense]